ncbi:insulinase family protein [Pelagicoccus sp. SDUM812003]|uniref:M16 family metallopeptidase n=1 Tax=Pelagicoccus sp. SDUM812003 TaxID=3041267 RepID=UPI002810825D|nr:insulinase family protein [Pelagicoccus sp. SDUM812003]MDQ8202339.1 insulinase family protein [Pelagicoccus sp. SDUM812003]
MLFLKRIPLIALIILAFAPAGVAQLPEDFDLEGPLPVDPNVRTGTLENGLRYYVRENGKPENRASLRLVINAGSLQEDDNQRGIAHFLEHMAFNGTEHFQKMELVNFLEGIGMNFGQHLNASTSFDQTIYQLEVPWEDPEVIDKAFLILEDWAANLTLDPYEIEQERGVIVEEWRSGQGAGQRIRDQQYPLIYYNSRYAKRLPIGSMVVVQNAPAERFRDFYEKWYRPNLMAVIAVGDFDGAQIEQTIIDRFSKLSNPEDAPERVNYEVPDHEQTLFSIISDPELTSTSVNIYLKVDPDPDSSAIDYRRHLLRRIYFSMLNQRLAERGIVADPPYLSAGVGHSKLGREKAAYYMSIGLLEDKIQEGIETVVSEVTRAARDGFSQSELDRAVADMIRVMDRYYDQRDTTQSSVFASEYTRAFTVDEPIPGIALERAMTRAFLDGLKVDEVNVVGEAFQRRDNRVILFTAPEGDGRELPSEEDLLAAIEAGEQADIGEYVDEVSDAPLLSEEPTPGEIVEETYHQEVDTYEWLLSNGARVLVKATDFQADQILMSAYSEGGRSLVMDDEFVPAVTSTMLLGESGIGPFNTIELDKKLAGTTIRLSPSINENSETLSGSASPSDLETFFKLLYLQITHPNEEDLSVAFESVRTRLTSLVANRQKSPGAVFQDAIEKELYGDHPRHQPLDLARLEEMDAPLSLEIFKDRFQNAGDFVFCFVGAMDLDQMREYVKRYIASLPSEGGEAEKARFHGDKPAEGRLSVDVSKGLEEKTSVRVFFNGDAEWSPENRYAFAFARALLNIRMREVLREENSGVYGVGVFGTLSRLPEPSYSSGFAFSCDPGNAEMLVRLGLLEIIALQEQGPRPENVRKVREQHIREHENGLRENGFWLNNLMGVYREGRPFSEILEFPERVRSFDPEEARQAAIRYFDMQNLLIAYLRPEYQE